MKTILLLSALLFAAAMPVAEVSADKAPELAVTTLDGQAWSLAEQRGNWVLVNYWATWCAPCIKEMPEIDHFVSTHEQVVAIGLAFQDADAETIRAFLVDHAVDYPIALVDPFSPPAGLDTPLGLPTTFLINPEGSVAKKFVGPVTAVDLARAVGAESSEAP